MPKDYGKTLTRLFVSATQSFGVASVDEAFAEFVQAGWEEQRDPGTGFRCLVQFDADIDMHLDFGMGTADFTAAKKK